MPNKAKDAALLAQGKDDNAVRRKKDCKDEMILKLIDCNQEGVIELENI